jgi:predicted RNA-binding protein YlxR (DUF448 family)
LPRKRHIPERSCVACGDKKPKAELLRIVRSPEGVVYVDRNGKAQGRGAYICGPKCWDSALGRGKLARSLGTVLSKQNMTDLRDDGLQS